MKLANYLNTINYAKKIFVKNGDSPIYVILFVTERCNARCKHCFGSFSNNKQKIKEELTQEEIEKISKKAGNLLYLLPTGGEPFLREDLPHIINAFYKNNHLWSIKHYNRRSKRQQSRVLCRRYIKRYPNRCSFLVEVE